MNLNTEEIKIIGINVGALIVSMTDVIEILQVIVLSATFLYTAYKFIRIVRQDRKTKRDEKADN